MGLNPREQSERQFDGSKQIIPGNGVKTVEKKKNPFQDIIKQIESLPGPWPTPPPTPSMTVTPTITPSITPSNTVTPTNTPTQTKTPTPTPSMTVTPTITPSVTPSDTPKPTPTKTPTNTPTKTTTQTPTKTPTQTPTKTPTQTPTKTPTQTPTKTPTNTPTKTTTQTPTKTPTQTPTNTPTNTPSMTQTPTVTPTITQTPTNTPTVTPTITPSPSRVSLIGPFFRFANIAGLVESLSIITQTGQTFDVRWGDGTFLNAVPNSSSASPYGFAKNLGGVVFTGSADNFRVSGVSSVSKVSGFTANFISYIEPNQYTFSAFTAMTTILVGNSTVTGFTHSLPSTIQNLYILKCNPVSNFFVFDPKFTGRSNFVELSIAESNIQTFNTSLTGMAQNQKLTIRNNPSLTSITTNFSSVYDIFQINVNTGLTTISVSSGFTGINMPIININQNSSLTGWTYNLPTSLQTCNMTFNNFSSFNINLTANTQLNSISVFNNKITSFTQTVSACTSLAYLRVDYNRLTSLPPLFPNSLQTFNFQENRVTGYTSNIPTGLTDFEGSSEINGLHNIATWNVDLTGATGLRFFRLNKVQLETWSKQFPLSIRIIEFRFNKLSSINVNLLSGATTVDLEGNPLITMNNLNANNTIEVLKLTQTSFTGPPVGPSTNFPSSLKEFYMGGCNISSWNKSFSSAPLLRKVVFSNNPLTQTSVNYILNDLANNNTVVGGELYLNGIGPATPTGGSNNSNKLILEGRNWQVYIN